MTTSELTISEQSLTFAKTVPGKPVFLVVRVATDDKNVQVTASTDLPAVFQLASDDRPIFGSMLTLIPESAGTYIHIRYQPERPGVHEGTLTLQSAVGTRTVSLTGRCTRMATVATNPNSVLTRTVASREVKAAKSRAGMLVAGAAVLVGLLYTGITYRCQLMPSLCQQDATTASQAVSSPAVPVVETPVSSPASEPVASVKAVTKRTSTKPTGQNSQERKRTSGKQLATRAVEPAATADIKPSPPASRATATKTVLVARPKVESARPARPANESEESDLERELNGRSSQNR